MRDKDILARWNTAEMAEIDALSENCKISAGNLPARSNEPNRLDC